MITLISEYELQRRVYLSKSLMDALVFAAAFGKIADVHETVYGNYLIFI